MEVGEVSAEVMKVEGWWPWGEGMGADESTEHAQSGVQQSQGVWNTGQSRLLGDLDGTKCIAVFRAQA